MLHADPKPVPSLKAGGPWGQSIQQRAPPPPLPPHPPTHTTTTISTHHLPEEPGQGLCPAPGVGRQQAALRITLCQVQQDGTALKHGQVAGGMVHCGSEGGRGAGGGG